ncbi:hypothetical protein [Variovorax sp. LT1R16]|uniref:hypothetical protein n=1 Tax=Variovorax sp. LT1R16 TaxID=3443728 RepID=UPI003F484D8D
MREVAAANASSEPTRPLDASVAATAGALAAHTGRFAFAQTGDIKVALIAGKREIPASEINLPIRDKR